MEKPSDRRSNANLVDTAVPMTAAEFERQKRAKIIRIAVPSAVALIIVALGTWLAIKPRKTQNFFEDAQTDFKAGKYRETVALVNNVLREQPGNIEAYRMRALSYLELGENDAATKDFDKLIQLRPNDPEWYRQRARLLLSRGFHQDAMADYTRIINLTPSAEAYAGRALCLRETGKPKEAISDFLRAIEMGPSVDYYLQLGWTYQNLNNFKAAMDNFSKAIDLRPDVPYPYRARASVREQLGDRAGAAADRDIADKVEAPISPMPPAGTKAKKT